MTDLRRIETMDEGEIVSAEEALRRVSKWARGNPGLVLLDNEKLGSLLSDIKAAIGYLAFAQETHIIGKDKQ